MRTLAASVYKEILLALRDKEGLFIVFIMPIILLLVMTLLQQRTFETYTGTAVSTLLINCDQDSLGNRIERNFTESAALKTTLIKECNSDVFDKMHRMVGKGDFQAGIYIPAGLTAQFRRQLANNRLSSDFDTIEIRLLFDPGLNYMFRQSVKSRLREQLLELQIRFYNELLAIPKEPIMLSFTEQSHSEYSIGNIPDTVQHNVPAWILFGMFLIGVPVAGNIIRERNQGQLARLKTMPISYWQIMFGKITVFVIQGMLIALVILLLGHYFMPFLDLPPLKVSGRWSALFIISFASSLAAGSFGILLGSAFTTHLQASAFGSVSTVIFAAVGGAWIPVMIMPPIMQQISRYTPINRGIQGYYKIFLHDATSLEIIPDVLWLLCFSLVSMALAVLFKKYLNSFTTLLIFLGASFFL